MVSHFYQDCSTQNAIIQLWLDLGDILKQCSRLEGVTVISELNYHKGFVPYKVKIEDDARRDVRLSNKSDLLRIQRTEELTPTLASHFLHFDPWKLEW